jgi:predicted nuclease of predicted toxin-antitoxin system
MNFLVDAQLPRRLCAWLREAGHDVWHTLDLPLGNRTPDSVIPDIAKRESCIVVTKDDDFVQSYLVSGRPEKLLLIATGNIGNAELETLLRANLTAILNALETGKFVEINRSALTVHDE